MPNQAQDTKVVKEGLQHLARLLEEVTAEEGEGTTSSSPAVQRDVALHILRLSSLLVSSASSSTEAMDIYRYGTATLLCAWLQQHLTLSSEAEREMLLRMGMDRDTWWWCPSVESSPSAPQWASEVLHAIQLHRGIKSHPTSATQEQQLLHLYVWWTEREEVAALLKEENSFNDLLHCFVLQVLQLESTLEPPPFLCRVEVTGADMREVFEVTSFALYQAAVWYSIAALQDTLEELQTLEKRKSNSEMQRMAIRSAMTKNLPHVFTCLLEATDVSRIACSQFESETAAVFLRDVLRPAMLGCPPDEFCREPHAILQVHPAAELSGCASRILFNRPAALVATEPIGEGECVSCETPLLWWNRTTVDDGSPAASVMKDLLQLVRDAELELLEDLVEGKWLGGPEGATGQFLFGDSSAAHASAAHYLRMCCQIGAAAEPGGTALREETFLQRCLQFYSVDPLRSVGLHDIDEFKVGLAVYDPIPSSGGGEPGKPNTNFLCSAAPHEWGKAAYHFTTFYSHSCNPNVLLHFPVNERGECVGTVVATALRDIGEGETLTVDRCGSLLCSRRQMAAALGGVKCLCATCKSYHEHLQREGAVCFGCHQLVCDMPCPVGQEDHDSECEWKASEVCRELVLKFEAALEDVYTIIDQGPPAGQSELYFHRFVMELLMNLDSSSPFPATHYLRLRVRQEVLAIACAYHPSTSSISSVISLAEELLESTMSLLPLHHTLITGYRMMCVLFRSLRTASCAATHLGHHCCSQEMNRPFLRDAAIRCHVIESFQDHFVQQIAWREQLGEEMSDDAVLQSFLRRYRVSLEAAGILNADHMGTLSVLADSNGEGSHTRSERLPGDLFPAHYQPELTCP